MHAVWDKSRKVDVSDIQRWSYTLFIVCATIALLGGRYRNAAEMYAKVLALKPQEWRAHLNRGVSLLGAGDYEEARRAFREAFKMTNRVELYDAINHLKQMQKRPKGLTLAIASAEQSATGQHDSIAGEIFGWRK